MEVFGISSSNPSSVGDDSYNQSTPNPIGGNESILEVLKRSHEVQNQVLEILRGGGDVNFEKDQNTQQLELNTVAIYDLISSLENIKADITISGIDSDIFDSMAKLGKNDKKMLAIEKFGDVYESVVKKIGGLAKYIKDINGVTKAVTGAFGTVKELGKGMLVFAGGLALLGFTLATFMSAITLQDIMVFAGIMTVLWGASKLIGNASWDLAKVSVGIATLGLTLWAFMEVIDAKKSLEFVVSMAAITAGIRVLMLGSKSMEKGYMGIIRGAGAIAAIAGSVWLLNKAVSDFDDVDLIKVGKMALVIGGLGVVYGVMGSGNAPVNIAFGSAAALLMGASLWVLSAGIQEMGKIDMSLGRGVEIAAIFIATAGILAFIGNPATALLIATGAGVTAAIGIAFWALAEGLQALTTVSVSTEQSMEFKNSLINVIDALSYLGNPFRMASMIVAVPAGLAVAGATLALTTAMWAVSKMPTIDDAKRDSFKLTLENLVDTYSGLGVWGLIKATHASAVVAIISGATMVTAGAIWAFTKISANPDAVDNAVLSLDKFIGGVSDTFEKNSGRFDMIGKGTRKFMGLSGMVSEIADSVQRISNLEFLEKEVRNGQVVVTGVRKFTPDDFANVGVSIGRILNALTDPLAQIASEKDSYSIGGFTITNPFSNKVQKGIAAMSGIGKVFNPLVNIIDSFAKNGMDETKIENFNSNIGLMLQGIGDSFGKTHIYIDRSLMKGMKRANDLIGELIGYVSNPEFGNGSKSFENFGKNIASVKDSLNGINLEKLSTMNEMVFNLNEMEKSGAIDEFVDAFKEFLDHLLKMESSAKPVVAETTNNDNTIYKETPKGVASNTNGIDSDAIQKIVSSSNGDLVEIMDKLYSFLSSGNLKVQMKQGLI